MMRIPPFHIAIPISNMRKTMEFYGGVMNCVQGRKCPKDSYIFYNFFGHQLVCHYIHEDYIPQYYINPGDGVPIPHFGLCLSVQEWHEARDLLVKGKTKFEIEPHLIHEGKPAEEYKMFFKDPTGNNF